MSYDQYDPGGLTIEELNNRLIALQSRLASTISDVKREDGLLTERQSIIEQDIDSLTLSVSNLTTTTDGHTANISTLTVRADGIDTRVAAIDTRVGAAETSISQNAGEIALRASIATVDALTSRVSSAESSISVQASQIALKVEKDGVIGAINLTSEVARIQASKINLVGAVTVLSDITGSLGTITAGDIYGVNIYGGTISSDTSINVGTNATIGGQLNLGTNIAINDFKINFGNVADFTVWMGNSNEYHINYNAFKHHFYGTVDFSTATVEGLNVTVSFG